MKLFASILFVAAIAPSAHAVVVIDNLVPGAQGFATGASGPAAGGVGPLFAGAKNNQTAFQFTTGPAGGDLVSMDLVISVADNASPVVATISTGTNVPGGINPVTLGTVTPTATAGITTINFAPASPVTLASNSTYWVHLTVPAGAGWYSILNSDAPVESLGWDLGNTWSKPAIGAWNEITSGPQARAQFNIAPVPEPHTALLGGIAFLLLLGRKR